MESYGLLVVILTSFVVTSTGQQYRSKVDIAKEIERLEAMLGNNMQTSQELITSVVRQLEAHCLANRTIDESIFHNATQCVEKHVNQTRVFEDVKKVVPEGGQLDNVFKDTCLKWPKVRACLTEYFKLIDDCWPRGHKINDAINAAVRFICDDDNEARKITLFVADGGIQCLSDHGDEVKVCIENIEEFPEAAKNLNLNELQSDPNLNLNSLNKLQIPDVSKDDFCGYLEKIKECTTHNLKKCNDPTPENLATSMIFAIGRAIDCKLRDDHSRTSRTSLSTASSSSSVFAFTTLTLVPILKLILV